MPPAVHPDSPSGPLATFSEPTFGTGATRLVNPAGVSPYTEWGRPLVADLSTLPADDTDASRADLERQLSAAGRWQLSRAPLLLVAVSQLVARSRDTQELFAQACQILVDKGGFCMAWIGSFVPAHRGFQPVASAGNAADFFDHFATDLRQPAMPADPSTAALRSGHYQVWQDLESESHLFAWRQTALRCAYRSLAAFPLLMCGRLRASLNLFADRSDFFDPTEIQLLQEVARDVSFALERLERERETQMALDRLRESEEQFRQLAENIEEVTWVWELATQRMLFISPACERVWGLSRENLRVRPDSWLDVVYPEDRERVRHAWQEARLNPGAMNVEYRILRPDGAVRWVHARGFPIHDQRGEVYRMAGVAVDLTERRKHERLAIRSQRLEAIGTLAGGLAHELNNALAPILVSVQMLRQDYQGDSGTLDAMQVSAHRAADTVRQLLAFANGVEGQRPAQQLGLLVREVERIARSTFPKNLRVETHYQDPLPLVLGDATQLHQVLLNLCVNALDAMPQGGTLRLRAREMTADAAFAAARPEARPGRYVVLEVGDTGSGIAPELLDRIFDPFFTTKGLERGTGLGLSTTLGIVRSHGGFVNVTSQLGRGSLFSVYLPADPASEPFGAAPEPESNFRGQGELVLVVDDEPAIRQSTKLVLERLNFRVITAADGAEALIQVAEHRQGLRAILTDFHMPRMDGMHFVQALRFMRPEIPVVLASGLLEEQVRHDFQRLQVSLILEKPFTESHLSIALQAALA